MQFMNPALSQSFLNFPAGLVVSLISSRNRGHWTQSTGPKYPIRTMLPDQMGKGIFILASLALTQMVDSVMVNSDAPDGGRTWVLLVAGVKDWENYGMQASKIDNTRKIYVFIRENRLSPVSSVFYDSQQCNNGTDRQSKHLKHMQSAQA